MDDANPIGENLMYLDLNQEPLDPPAGSVSRYGSFLNELDTAHDSIEDRMRHLEAITARASQRQRWRQARNSLEISHLSGDPMVNVDGERGVSAGNDSVDVLERTIERGKGCKRDSSHLVAKALAMDSEVKKVDKDGGSFFDCNICLDVARDPVLTCCGHLFCWVCFYQVSYIDSTCKECPVCKGEVSDSTVTPIYGNGSSESILELESGLKIPPRPKARRVESVRQQHITHAASQIPVAEALRRIRIGIGAMGDQTQEQEDGSGNLTSELDSQELQNIQTTSSRRLRSRQFSRVLPESDASLSSLSSALSNMGRLVGDLQTVISDSSLQLDDQVLSLNARNPLTRNSAFIQSDHRPSGSRSEIITEMPTPSSSRRSDIPGDAALTVSMRTDSGINLPVAPSFSSPSRRRRITSRVSEVGNRDSSEFRRRRFS